MRSIIFSFDAGAAPKLHELDESADRPIKRPGSPQTRRRNDLPDTTTVTIRHMTDSERLFHKILDTDPNRSTHYLPPKLKGRILR